MSKPKIKKAALSLFAVISILFSTASGYAYFKVPSPIKAPVIDKAIILTAENPLINWPANGSASINIEAYGVNLGSDSQKVRPIASISKVMVALAVIKQKPLGLGEQGPEITIGQEDIESYYEQLSQGGSVIPVNFGEILTQYQALQALLLPSANNIAETLVRWAFGSEEAYQSYAGQLAREIGLTNSVFIDPSGLEPTTVSTASDLTKLGFELLKEPVLKEIVSQTEAVLPVAGKVKNVNSLLGQEGIIGIKTGTTFEAGGCLLFAAVKTLQGQEVTLVGSVLGETSRYQALNSSLKLVQDTFDNFQTKTIIVKNQPIAEYSSRWGAKTQVVAKDVLEITRWPAGEVKREVYLRPITLKDQKNTEIGSLKVIYGSKQETVPLILNDSLNKPSFLWKLKHLFDL